MYWNLMYSFQERLTGTGIYTQLVHQPIKAILHFFPEILFVSKIVIKKKICAVLIGLSRVRTG